MSPWTVSSLAMGLPNAVNSEAGHWASKSDSFKIWSFSIYEKAKGTAPSAVNRIVGRLDLAQKPFVTVSLQPDG